jgi:hypothetical protein
MELLLAPDTEQTREQANNIPPFAAPATKGGHFCRQEKKEMRPWSAGASHSHLNSLDFLIQIR